jgi:hypothetical protein
VKTSNLTRIGEIIFLGSVRRLLVTAGVVSSSPNLIILMMAKCRFLQEPHGVTSQEDGILELLIRIQKKTVHEIRIRNDVLKKQAAPGSGPEYGRHISLPSCQGV